MQSQKKKKKLKIWNYKEMLKLSHRKLRIVTLRLREKAKIASRNNSTAKMRRGAEREESEGKRVGGKTIRLKKLGCVSVNVIRV